MKILKKAAFLATLLAVFAQNLLAQSTKEADAFFQLGQIDKAIVMYRGLSQAAPTDANLMLSLGNLFLAQGLNDKALEYFTKAAAAQPDEAIAYVANARVALLKGNTDESVKMLNKAVKAARGKNTNLLRQAGETYLFGKTRNLKRAAEILEAANESNTKDIPTLMILGWVSKELVDGGKAVTYYEYASDQMKTDPLPLFRIGLVYLQSRNFPKYEEYMKKALAVDPKFTPAARDLGDYYYKTYKIGEAKSMYDTFIEGKDVSIEDRMQYANILFLNKNYDKLVPYVEDVIKTDGSRNYLRRVLGYAAFETGDYDKGLNIMNDYFSKVQADKIIADDYEFYGKLLEKKGQDSLAAVSYLKGAAMSPSNWKLKKLAGLLYVNKLKKFSDAVPLLQTALDSLSVEGGDDPNSLDYYYLGYALERGPKDYKKADAMYTKITELNPSSPFGYSNRARVNKHFEPDSVDTNPAAAALFGVAKPFHDKVIELGSADVKKNKRALTDAYLYLYAYHAIKGDNAKAKESAQKALEISPESTDAAEALKQLEAVEAAPAPPNGQKNK